MTEIRAAYPAELLVCLECGLWVIAQVEFPCYYQHVCPEHEDHRCEHLCPVLVGFKDVEFGTDGRAVRVKLDQEWRETRCAAAGREHPRV
jgi:hypothetical protein